MMNKGRKFKIATALKYRMGDNAPIVVASGKGIIADRIIETAKKNKVHIHIDPDCASLLSLVEVGGEIPQELYEIVAKVLAFVNSIDKKFKL